jgi:hypothetical protein
MRPRIPAAAATLRLNMDTMPSIKATGYSIIISRNPTEPAVTVKEADDDDPPCMTKLYTLKRLK